MSGSKHNAFIQPSAAQCIDALSAFGFIPDYSGPFSPTVLKHDTASIVMLVRCLPSQDPPEAQATLYVLKARPGSTLFYPAAISAHLESLVGADLVPPPRLTTTTGGASWSSNAALVTSEQADRLDLVWSLRTYVPHTPAFDWLNAEPRWTATQSKNAGRLIARLHQAGRTARSSLDASDSKILASVLPALPALIDAALAEHKLPHTISRTVHTAVDWLTKGPQSGEIAAAATVVHGDFHPGNVLFAADEAKFLIDFDYAHLEHPLYDLAYASVIFDRHGLGPQMSEALLAGYNQYNSQHRLHEPVSQEQAFHCFSKVAAALILLWSLSELPSDAEKQTALTTEMVELLCRV